MTTPAHRLVRGQLLHFLADPGMGDDPAAWQFFDDGGLWIRDGRIQAAGPWAALPPGVGESATVHDYRGHLVLPGFVDCHLHYPQAGVIASYGRQLLDWLNDYVFPAEARFADASEAERTAAFVVRRLLAHGTTTASVFATVHPHSVDAFFAAAEARGLRMLCGKVLMDRNCPADLRDTAAGGIADSLRLIERWHGRGRLRYSLTPRFAPTSSPEQLRLCGELLASQPGLHLQTHLAENPCELDWVRQLFPTRGSYLDVYQHYGLAGPRSLHAHCIHLDAAERRSLAAGGAAAAFCPGSNLFLGSGLFRLHPLKQAGVWVGLGTDVGAGTSFSMLQTLNEGYKVQQLQGEKLSAREGLYQATLGGAEALQLAGRIGSFQPGREADFVVLEWGATPLQQLRQSQARTLDDRLFALMMQGDDRNVVATYVNGEQAYRRP